MSTSTTSAPSVSDVQQLGLLPRYPHVAFIGKAGSGKTTAADYLVKHYGYHRVSFAALLKDIAVRLWGDTARQDRGKLQKLGVAVRSIEENTWVDAALRGIETWHVPVVIDDCRFPNEAGALQKHHFVFVRINAPVDLRVHRLQEINKFQNREQLEHISETALDSLAGDHQIDNDEGIDLFKRAIDATIYREVSRT